MLSLDLGDKSKAKAKMGLRNSISYFMKSRSLTKDYILYSSLNRILPEIDEYLGWNWLKISSLFFSVSLYAHIYIYIHGISEIKEVLAFFLVSICSYIYSISEIKSFSFFLVSKQTKEYKNIYLCAFWVVVNGAGGGKNPNY